LRILALNWQDLTHPQAGGAEVHLEEILRRVVSWGHEVSLACCTYPGCKTRENIGGMAVYRRGGRQTFNFIAPTLIRQILDEKPHDLLVEDINKIPFYLPMFFKMPHLAVIPHLFGRNIYQEANPVIASYVYFAEKPIKSVYRKSGFLAISESTRLDLVRRGIAADRIGVAECGVDHDVYNPEQPVVKYDRPTVVYLGRIKKYKSVHHLVQALPAIQKSVPNVRALIVGDGDYLESLKQIVARLGLQDAVELTGFVNLAEKLTHLRRSHVSVYLSPKEGWGITNIEANACGTPVVAANVSGLKDSVSHGKSGLLYEYGNIEELAQQVVRVLSDKPLYQSLSQGALEWANRFTWDDCARRSLAIMEKTHSEWGKHA
jgi:glycosyltransferase involved in cell wall biosynthesis